MPSLDSLALFLAAGLALNLTPGPDMLYVAGPLQLASLAAIFRQGVITNVFNPKVALFFLAFLPQLVDPARGNPVLQVIFLGLLFNVSGTIVNLVVAVASSRAAERLKAPGMWMQRVTGGVFVLLGVRLAVSTRS